MADIVAESFLEGYDELNLEVAFTRAVATSVTYSLYSRLTDNAEAYFDEENFRNIFEFNTRKSVNALGTAVSTISTEIFHEIEKTVIAYEQQKEVERSERYDDTDELQPDWGIFDSGNSVTEHRSEAIREVSKNEESVPQGEQTNDLQRHDLDGNTVSAPLGSGRNSEQENGSADEPVAREESGTEQERKSDLLGAAHERIKGTSRRNDYDGANQQLTLDLFLSEQEQIRWIDEAESVETNTTFAFSFAQEDIDTILIHGSNTDNARMMVATEFMKQKSADEIAESLKTIYHGGYGLKTSRGAVSAWYGEDGIHLAKGNTARYSNANIISWNDVAERIGELLENGQFATNVELVEAANFEKTQIAQKLWYLVRDFSDESKELHLLPILSEIRGIGFPNETKELAERLNDTDFCNQLAAEYEDFIRKYVADRSILRFRYHRVYELQKSIKELFLDRRNYETEMFDFPERKTFITDDEINADLARGSGISGGKGRIYDFFTESYDTKSKADFLKNEFGTGGHSHALSGATHSGQDHSAKGIVYKKENCETVNLNWTQVANRISEMIRKNRYLTAEELEERKSKEAEKIEIEPIEESTVEFDEVLEDIADEEVEDYPFDVGQRVYLEGTEFEITEIRDHEVQLLDPSLLYPIFRVESKANFERLVELDTKNKEIKEESVEIPAVNYIISNEHLGEGGPKQKFARNIEAIKLLYVLEKENRNATFEEQEILSNYVGWGGLADAFDSNKPNWSNEFQELKNLLPEKEYEMARASTLNAHYTSPVVIKSMYEALSQLGFKTGNILEPSMGIGNFFGLLPESMRGSNITELSLILSLVALLRNFIQTLILK